jgi:hypothetical protein
MTLAFERWIARQDGIAGIISAGGSGGTAMVRPPCARCRGRAQADRLDRRVGEVANMSARPTSR